jgi:hypothetical protein
MNHKKHNGQPLSGAAGFLLAGLLAFAFLFAACESPAGRGEDDITWTALADGESGAQNSTAITITFSAAVTELTAGNITVTNGTGSVTTGSLTNTDDTHWSLGITVSTAGSVKVKIKKAGIETTEKDVAVYKEDISSLTLTVTFDKNGGTTEADPSRISVTWPDNTVDLPSPPSREDGLVFRGWNTEADGSGAQFTAATEISESLTVYALWGAPVGGMPTSAAEVAEWLSMQPGGSRASPVNLALDIDLGDMADGSNWYALLDALDEAKKYVALDLSDCAMTGAAEDGTVFRPNYAVQGPTSALGEKIATYTGGGKAYIVELTLPLGAKKISGGWAPPFSVAYLSVFRGFDNLEKIRGDNIEGGYSEGTGFSKTAIFTGLSSLKEAHFEKLAVASGFFEDCRNLESVYCPALTEIGYKTFLGCTNLKTFDFSNVRSIENNAFARSGLVTLDLSTSQVTRIHGENRPGGANGAFNGCSDLETILFPACLADIGNYKYLLNPDPRGGFPFRGCPKIREVTFLGDPADIAWVESGPPYDTGLDDDLIILALSGETVEERTGTYVKADGAWSKKP